MLLYYLFWMFMGFIKHFYIIFGTNLLTQSPVPVPVFSLFQCFEEKEYQTESKRNEIFWRSYFWKESNPGDLESTSRKQRGRHEAWGRAHPRWACPPPSWAPRGSPDVFLPPIYIYPYTLKRSGNRIDREFRRRKPL